MELADPRVAFNVQRIVYRLGQIRLGMFLVPRFVPTFNQVPIYVDNFVSLLLATFGTGLLFAVASRRLGKRHKNLNSFLDTFGWGFLILMPAMIVWVTETPSLLHGTGYWNYLGYVWYYGYFAISIVWLDFVFLQSKVRRRIIRAIPRTWKALVKPDVPQYIRSLIVTLNRLP